MVRGFSHTLRSGGTDGAWQPLSRLAGFQGGRTPLVSGFTPFVWLWHQHTQLHCLGECGRRGRWVGAAGAYGTGFSKSLGFSSSPKVSPVHLFMFQVSSKVLFSTFNISFWGSYSPWTQLTDK